jgi:hypothetical protein
MLGSFMPALERLHANNPIFGNIAEMPQTIKDDHGRSLLLSAILAEPGFAVDEFSVTTQLYLMADRSVKLCALSALLKFHVMGRKEKMLILCVSPKTQIVDEQFLLYFGFRAAGIRQSSTGIARGAIIEDFNSDREESAQVLVSTIRIIGFAVNLHHACNVAVAMDIPQHLSELLQGWSRVMRPGQPRVPFLYALSCRGTIDRNLLGKNVEKF